MKKILLLTVVSVLSLHAFPQNRLVKYQGEVSVGYAFGIGKIDNNKASLQIVNGVRIGKYFAVGLGLGWDCRGEYAWGLSTFGNLKGYLPVSEKKSLFLSTDVGGGWGKANSGEINGVIVSPALGVSLKVSPKSAINVSLAYTHQALGKYTLGAYGNYDALGFKVGFQF